MLQGKVVRGRSAPLSIQDGGASQRRLRGRNLGVPSGLTWAEIAAVAERGVLIGADWDPGWTPVFQANSLLSSASQVRFHLDAD
jgi:hypothetical protein